MVDFERGAGADGGEGLRGGGVTDAPILARMRATPRENFVPAERRPVAYADAVHWFDDAGRFLAAPATQAKLLCRHCR